MGFWKVWPSPWPCGLLVLGPVVRGPVVSGPLVPRSFGLLVLWSRGPLVPWSSGPVRATILAQSRSILRESTLRVYVLYIGQSRCGDKGFTVSGVNPEDPKAQKLQYTPHMNPLRPVITTLCLQMGGGCAPPNPPAVFLRRAGLLSRTSHPEQDLHQTRNCFRAFQISS